MMKAPVPTIEKEEALKRFDGISVWKRGDERAPHKPLLVLLALGRCFNRQERLVSFEEIEPQLESVLSEFGPPRVVCHPEYPFCRLQNDGLWTVQTTDAPVKVKGNTDPKKSELRRYHAKGGFPPDLFSLLHDDPILITTIAKRLLDANFPASLHTDILSAVGLPAVAGVASARVRDVQFRIAVIRAYQHRCAVCGYDMRLGNCDLGIEAAHIKWHQAGGPDTITNGLCLCVLHHRVFDRGALGIDDDCRIVISEEVHGGTAVEEWLLRFEGQFLRKPQRRDQSPSKDFVNWHQREVFRSPARDRPEDGAFVESNVKI